MLDFDTLKEIGVIKTTEKKQICLMEDPCGKKFIKYIFEEDKREIYKTLQKINHPNVPAIHNVMFNGKTIVIADFIDGRPLSEHLNGNEKFSEKQIKNISCQILDALDALHKQNIIHRDIKPDNIIMDNSGNVWLSDYDISRIYRTAIKKDTEIMGTFGYAPIEQYGMLPTDFKTDIYAFGVTLKALLDTSGIKGKLLKIADKCRRLDPMQRYESVSDVKKAFSSKKMCIGICGVAFVLSLIIIIILAVSNSGATSSKKSDLTDNQSEKSYSDDTSGDLIRFTNTMVSEGFVDYSEYENVNTAAIFSGKGRWHLLSLMSDTSVKATVLMGKNHSTPVEAEMHLYDGVFTLNLNDEFGHSFNHDFYYDNNHPFEVIYPQNRRINSELTCRDLDGDGVEELLVGIGDCSFNVKDKTLYPYFNYCLGWIVRYDEARGFILCEGDMFSQNSKFVFVDGDVRIHLAKNAVNTETTYGYELKGNKITPYK
ncbi:MAG: serine/threonine protein kinase [Clostridia bacterium]|nr:serine/threonine protein kinase [Clostridia bacterium]